MVSIENSYLHFGFKKGIGCNHALYTVKSVVEHFTAAGSVVNLCAWDMSKAFDKVNHYALWIKLMDRSVPLIFLLMVDICCSEAAKLDMKFNASKSQAIRIGRSRRTDICHITRWHGSARVF